MRAWIKLFENNEQSLEWIEGFLHEFNDGLDDALVDEHYVDPPEPLRWIYGSLYGRASVRGVHVFGGEEFG